ncbi:MAG TPA: AtpZ/AtpI family protein [Polyangia bacterium]|nr:AtpZ/AtpI family protein [Polyangia bacterium]
MALVWAVSLGAELFVYFWLGFDVAPKADHHFHTEPVLKILGLIIGIGCPINALVRVVREYNKQSERKDERDHDDQHQPPHG